jgi:hypothetical protein
MDFYRKMFMFSIYGLEFLYFLLFIGIGIVKPEYLSFAQIFLKYFISLFLIIRFNPFSSWDISKLDKDVTFSAGFLLLSTTTLYTFVFTKFTTTKLVQGVVKKLNPTL